MSYFAFAIALIAALGVWLRPKPMCDHDIKRIIKEHME